ncbi:phage tail sheath subtilisin-like domain-containing protein [Sphingomonas paucimobilis]|uniref:phage tail sheath subtilisin-like domain-containing protein n=1 Tax=Sphingomonas paucimobilis TaxID=13689 RepID=UPI0031D3E1E2
MTISFSTIPVSLRTPGAYIEFDASRAVSGLPPAPTKALLIGQRLAAGTVAPLTPTRIVSADQAAQAFGRGSMLHAMAAAYRAGDDLTELWAVGLSDLAGGTAATGQITVTAAAAAAGVIALMIDGVAVKVGVAAADAPATIATAIAAAVNALPDLPVTAASAAAVVTLTARHKGTAGNDLDVRANFYQGESYPAGVGLAFTAFAGGAGNPDFAAAIAAIGDASYSTIVVGFADAATMAAAEVEMARRWSAMEMIDGRVYFGARGTMAALAAIGNARNSPHLSIIGAKAAPHAPYRWAATFAAVVGFHGAIDPARPFQTLALPGLIAPAQGDRFTRTERDLLLRDGVSTWTVDAGGAVLIERAITTYQVNPFGIEDTAFLDINTPMTLSYLRYAVRARILSKYPRHKLASDDTRATAGQAIVTPKVIRAELIALFRELEEAGLVENLDQFMADLIVERDKIDAGRVNALIPPDLVNQFRVFAARIQFIV